MRPLREKIERQQLLLARLPRLSVQILDHIRDHGRITMGDDVALMFVLSDEAASQLLDTL